MSRLFPALALGVVGSLAVAQFCHSAEPEIVGPWNLTQLKQAPTMRWLAKDGPVHSLLYTGEKFHGHDTEVFAFYASPATLGEAKAGSTFPGVVLIHGGGGTAFAEWAYLWAKRGYAAIAMDLAGCRPVDPIYDAAGAPVPNQAAKPDTRTRLPLGGPGQGPVEKFDSIGGEASEDWPYHAAASVIRAHSVLRSFPEVIADRTAVTGISWGGYTTCLVASLDDRFRAAVPVYGCGYLFEGESVQKPSIDKLGERRDDWIKAYDPSSLLARCRVPILFVNGTNDIHYPLDSYQKSYAVVPGQKQMRIEVNMRHGHPPGWAPQEIGLFIDSYCRQSKPLAQLGEPVLTQDRIQMACTSAVPLKSANLHYTADAGTRSGRTWHSIPAEITSVAITCRKPPADANTWFIAATDDRGAMVTSSVQFSSETKPMAQAEATQAAVGQKNHAMMLETPRPLPRVEDLGRAPLNSYGSLEATIENLRAHRPLDLNSNAWRRNHPQATHDEWARKAQALLAEGLHYDTGKLALDAVTTERWETESFVRETIEFNTTPWFRVPGYFYVPKNVSLPAPALVVFHEWGGPLLFGADRVSGEAIHPAITEHRNRNTSGRPLADWFASHGYAVIVIDAYHFGRRAPRGLNGLPETYDPAKLDDATLKRYDSLVRDSLYLGVKQLNWAGTTWAGVNYGDDSRCVDYLLSRKEVDPERIGCTGLSGGGWRTNIMAALEPRIKAAVSVGWMTTGDTQQPYNVNGAIGTFCLLPGVWNRIDIPDLIAMAAPKAVMVVSGTKDRLFPPLGQREAARQIADAYEWAKCPQRFLDYAPDKEHCYDAEIQNEALTWFDTHLKRQQTPAGVKSK